VGEGRRHTAPEVHLGCPDHVEEIWAARLKREKAQAQAALAVSSGIIKSGALSRTLKYPAGTEEPNGKHHAIMHSSLPMSVNSAMPVMYEFGHAGSNVVLPEEYEQMRRSGKSKSLLPCRCPS
jgi:hypothetical protein